MCIMKWNVPFGLSSGYCWFIMVIRRVLALGTAKNASNYILGMPQQIIFAKVPTFDRLQQHRGNCFAAKLHTLKKLQPH